MPGADMNDNAQLIHVILEDEPGFRWECRCGYHWALKDARTLTCPRCQRQGLDEAQQADCLKKRLERRAEAEAAAVAPGSFFPAR